MRIDVLAKEFSSVNLVLEIFSKYFILFTVKLLILINLKLFNIAIPN